MHAAMPSRQSVEEGGTMPFIRGYVTKLPSCSPSCVTLSKSVLCTPVPILYRAQDFTAPALVETGARFIRRIKAKIEQGRAIVS